MTTATAPAAPAAPTSRLATSRAGWRVALRMASRDVRTAKGRSALVVLLIGLPVIVLVAGLVLAMTAYDDDREQLASRLGGTAASIDQVQPYEVTQHANGSGASGTAKPVDGLTPDGSAADQAKALAPLFPGAHLVPLGQVQAVLSGGDRTVAGASIAVRHDDAARANVAPLAHVVSGRLPRTADEIAVTTVGAARGIPTSGALGVRLGTDAKRILTVVGVVDSPTQANAVVDLAAAPSAHGTILVDQSKPVTWDDVKRLNTYGLMITSREVVTNPPREYLLDSYDSAQGAFLTLAGAALAGVLLEMCLLAGPAFAIGAMRQRRALALAASNGATRSQLRKVVLGQALVLGTATAVLSTVVGVGLAVLAVHLLDHSRPDLGVRLPVDIPWLYVLAVAASAGIACVVAALVPARGLDRLDVVSVLRGASVSPTAHRGLPVLGLVLAAAGGMLVVWPIVGRYTDSWATLSIVAGAFLLVVGAILLVPMILAVAGRLTGSLPVAARMATRDATRQRGRAVPTVASLIGGAALVASIGTAVASGMAADARDYRPTVPAGWAVVSGNGDTGSTYDEALANRNAGLAAAAAQAAVPGTRLRTISVAGETYGFFPMPVDTMTQYAVLAPGCTREQLPSKPGDRMTEADQKVISRCVTLTSDGPVTPDVGPDGGMFPVISVLDVDTATRIYHLDDAAVAALERGEALSPAASGRTTWVRARTTGLTSESSTTTWEPGGELTIRSTPSLKHPATGYQVAPDASTMLLTPEAAKAAGWRTLPRTTILEKPGGFSDADEQAATAKVDELGVGGITVERGYRSSYLPVIAILFGTVALLSIVAVVVATALSVAESRRDLGTLASIGASGGTRRRFAAAQAAFLAAVGTVLGYVVGLVPGIAMCWPVTVRRVAVNGIMSDDSPMTDVIVRIPWAAMGITLVGICLLSALVAAVLAGREGPLTRRTA